MNNDNKKIILMENIWANRYPFQEGHTCFLVAEDICYYNFDYFPILCDLNKLLTSVAGMKCMFSLSFMNIPV